MSMSAEHQAAFGGACWVRAPLSPSAHATAFVATGNLGATAFVAGRANWRRVSGRPRLLRGVPIGGGSLGATAFVAGVPIGGGSRGDRVCCEITKEVLSERGSSEPQC